MAAGATDKSPFISFTDNVQGLANSSDEMVQTIVHGANKYGQVYPGLEKAQNLLKVRVPVERLVTPIQVFSKPRDIKQYKYIFDEGEVLLDSLDVAREGWKIKWQKNS